MIHTFRPDYQVVNRVPQAYPDEIIGEPMLFSAEPIFAYRKGGPVTRRILDALPEDAWFPDFGRHIVIDTRLHMLMPGMYPAIPGWHCDAWPRGKEGQPDTRDSLIGRKGIRHWVCIIGEPSFTEFAADEVKIVLDKDHVWRSVSKGVDGAPIATDFARDGEVVEFGIDQLHRATPADRHGWRFFLRLSHYQFEAQNQIRKQVQVYTTEHGGW